MNYTYWANALTGRIQDALIRACREGSRTKKFIYKDDFLFSSAQGQCPIRDRSAFPAQIKKLEYVSREEICAAVEHVVLTGFGMPPDDIPVAACRVLGFARVSDEMRSVISQCRDLLISQGRLQQRAETARSFNDEQRLRLGPCTCNSTPPFGRAVAVVGPLLCPG